MLDEPPADRPSTRTRSRTGPARAARERIKILFVAANSNAGERLALDVEYRAIEEGIRAAPHRDAFHLIPKLAARPDDLRQALLEHRPDVVHFACHGTPRAELVLAADQQGSAPMPAAALAALFHVLRDNLALVVFNACFAGEQAQAIGRSAGLAIGVRARIEDTAAIAFASALYSALAYGRSVRDAFELGVAAIQAAHPRQAALPELFEEPGLDARTVCLVGEVGPSAPASPARRRVSALIGVAACAALVWWLLRTPERREPSPPPLPGMVRFDGALLRPGVFALSRRPRVCASLTEEEDAVVREHPEQVAAIRVEPFDLDEREVTNRQLADWLNARADLWVATLHGVVRTRSQPAIPLALASEECGGGLTLTPDGRVRTSAEQSHGPAVCVTWYGASEYCRARGERLPLEAEWELAAKGPRGRPFPWGDEMPRQDGVAFDLRDGAAAHPRDVGTSPQDVSPEGVRDLAGSVAEWVEDSRGLKGEKTIRGGSWASRGPCHLLASGRKHVPAQRFSKDIGFRCAHSVLDGAPATKEVR